MDESKMKQEWARTIAERDRQASRADLFAEALKDSLKELHDLRRRTSSAIDKAQKAFARSRELNATADPVAVARQWDAKVLGVLRSDGPLPVFKIADMLSGDGSQHDGDAVRASVNRLRDGGLVDYDAQKHGFHVL